MEERYEPLNKMAGIEGLNPVQQGWKLYVISFYQKWLKMSNENKIYQEPPSCAESKTQGKVRQLDNLMCEALTLSKKKKCEGHYQVNWE